MRDQGHDVRKPLLWYSVSNIGWYSLVPPIIIVVLLPAGLLLARTGASPQVARIYVEFSMTLVAALAVWWPPFVFKERIEGEGREILYFLKPRGEGATALALGVSYWILLAPFMLVARGTPGFSAASVPLVLARCLFVTSLVFCLAFVLRSSALALILALLVNVAAMVPLENLTRSLMPAGRLGDEVAVAAVLFYAVSSAALLWLGEIRGRHFTS